MPIADAPVSPRQRGPALENLRNQKMARSALDYVRGSPMQFYEWLEKGSAAIPEGPEVWICGDCHVGNLGPVANADGRFKVEIRDFDGAPQAAAYRPLLVAVANPPWVP